MGKDISSKNAVTTVTETILVNRPCRLMVLSLPARAVWGRSAALEKIKNHVSTERKGAAAQRKWAAD